MPRYDRVEDIIQLALALQAPGPGLCLEDIQKRFGVGRRTAERMREAVDRLLPGISSQKGADGRKYWSLPPGCANGLLAWQPQELQALDEAIAEARRDGHGERLRALAALRDKMGALVEPDDAGGPAAQPRRPLAPLPRAIVEDRELTFSRRRADGERVSVHVHPYGLLAGPRPLLVAFHPNLGRTRLHPVDGISEAAALVTGFRRDPNIDLRRYAANATAQLDKGPVEVRWRFEGEAADDALEYEFHDEQVIEHRSDGSVEVRFEASGVVELAWHLFTWGDRAQSLAPPLLKERFDDMMRRALEIRPTAETRPTDPIDR